MVSYISPNSFHDFIFTIRKKFGSILISRRFFQKIKFGNKTNTFHSKYCKFVWKYYRVTKKKEFHLAVNLEIVNEISRYQIASKELFFFFFFFLGSKKDLLYGCNVIIWKFWERTKNLIFYFQKGHFNLEILDP